jgi:putative aldouronate transport system substrate-binding protein
MAMKNKKTMIILSLSMMGLLLGACSKSNGPEASTSPGAPEKPVELHVISRQLTDSDEVNLVKTELEKKLNIILKWEIKPAANYNQTTQVVLSSGDYPDMMELWWSDPQREIKAFAEDGVIQPLNTLLDKHGKNIKAARPDKDTWLYPFGDDKVYTIPSRFNESGVENIYTIRQDWLDKLGLKKPANLDELYNVAKAFTLNDPDGNGKQDTYGFGHGANGNKSLFSGTPFEFILNSYGIMSGWNNVDGKLVHSSVMPQMKDAITYYRKLYQEGLVEPEFPILTREKYMERKNQNKYGFEYWWSTNLDVETSAWWKDFMTGVPSAKVSFVTPFPAKDGKVVYPRTATRSYSPSVAIFTKDPVKQQKAMELIDYLASDEGAELAAFGLKGQQWKEENGKIVIAKQTPEETRKSGAGAYSWFFRQKINMRNLGDLPKQSIDAYKGIAVKPIEMDATPTQIKSGKALDDLRNNKLMKLVVDKNVDINDEFDNYAKEWLANGGQKMTEEANAAFSKKK